MKDLQPRSDKDLQEHVNRIADRSPAPCPDVDGDIWCAAPGSICLVCFHIAKDCDCGDIGHHEDPTTPVYVSLHEIEFLFRILPPANQDGLYPHGTKDFVKKLEAARRALEGG